MSVKSRKKARRAGAVAIEVEVISLENLSYRELQQIAKRQGYAANLSRVDLLAVLEP